MKKVYYLLCCLLIFAVTSCEYDNFDGPSETLRGKVVDVNTGKPVQTQIGDDGIRLKLLEYSWSDNPEPYWFSTMQDGTFNNTKIFKGEYNIEVIGPFVPIYQFDSNGNVIVDERQTVQVKGTTNLAFEVEPFLNVEWVGEPVINPDRTISVQVKITRGTSNVKYHKKIVDLRLFINSSSPYVGDNNYHQVYTNHLQGDNANNALDNVVTLKTNGKLPEGRTWYLRVGARIDYANESDGKRRYNYSTPISIKVP